MLRDCIKSRSFKIYKSTNDCKLDLIIDKANKILEYKNLISPLICENFHEFSQMSKFDFVKSYNHLNPKTISGQEAQKALEDVYDSYDNKKDKLINNIVFKIQKDIKIERYKVNTKNNHIGDIRCCSVITHQTKLSKTISYLVRYYDNGLLEYINSQLKLSDLDKNKKLFYLDILYYLNKFGKRIIDLATSKRNFEIARLTKYPIVFVSKTFRSVNRIRTNIVDKNKNANSVFNVFINLGGFDQELSIPTKFSNKFHGDMEKYTKKLNKKGVEKKSWDTAYTIVFKNDKPNKITLTIDSEEDIPVGKTNYIGVDTNVKNNLFYTSTNKIIDYDRKIIAGYCKFLEKLDKTQNIKKKESGKRQPFSKKNLRTWGFWLDQIRPMLKRRARELVDLAISEGKDHIVIEDLGKFAKTFISSEEFQGFKYSRLVRLLNLSDIKNIIKSIANKRGLQVTFIQPEYSSQTCNFCGNIDSRNRRSQELFICTHCGSIICADYNSSINICNRMSVDVLRTSLLTETEFGFEPKKVSKDFVRESVTSSYNILTLKDDGVKIKF